jgi:hypothetical protein
MRKINREQIAFFLTLILAVAFVIIGALKGTDEVFGLATSSTVTTTVQASVQSSIAITASATVNIGNVVPGVPGWKKGDVTVTSNCEEGWGLYNYADNYMTKTTTPYQSITDVPPGSASAPKPWTAGTTKGLGFALSGPIAEVKWHTSATANFNYASFTTTSAAAALVNNYTTWSSIAQNLNVIYVLDVATTQLTGPYQAIVSWYAITNV